MIRSVGFRAITALALTLAFVTGASAQAPVKLPPGVTRVTSVEGITEYALPNGLHVLTLPDASKATTTVNLTIKVGSRMENYGETGMAHLLEHLMFKGTPNHRDPKKEMSDRGLSWNGTTSDDRTNYFASMAENPTNLDFYLHWLSEALTKSFIAKKDLDSEMTVVRNEMESGENNPGNVLFQNMLASAYHWHNYANSTIGARADVENVDISRLQAFYRKYYQTDNAVLIIAGKFDEARTLAIVASTFGKLARPKRVIEPTYTLDPAQDGERTVTLRRVGDAPILFSLYHVPAGASPDYVPAMLASIMLGGPEFRLHKALVAKGLAAQAFGSAQALAEPGYAYFGAQLKSDQSVDAAKAALIATVEGVPATPFTQPELDRAKNIWLRGFQQTLNDPQRIGLALSEYVAIGDWRVGFDRRDRVKAATLDDVNRVAGQYFVTSDRTIGEFIPSPTPVRAPAPARVDIAVVMKDFKGGDAIVAGETFDASPENLEKRTTIATLPGPTGIKVALLPKTTRGGKVIALITLHFGDEKSLMGKDTIGDAAASMLSRGTERLSREELAAAFERLQTTWGVSGDEQGATFRVETTRANLEASLALAFEVLRKPRFDAGEFEQLRASWVSGIEDQRSDPQALLSERMARHGNPYPKGDVRYAMTIDESLTEAKQVSMDEARAFYRDYYGASNALVAVVGDFDPAAVSSQIVTGLGDWTSKLPYTRVPQPALDIPPTQFRIDVKDKQNAAAEGRLEFPLRESDREYQALRLAAQIFGGSGGGTGRLWSRIREKEGLSYGVGASISGGQYEANADWGFYAITAPQNADRVKTAFDEEYARALRDGFTADELKRAKDAIASASRLGRAQDGALVRAFTSFLDRGETPSYFARIDALRAQITLDEVNAAFRKYVVPSRFVYGVAGDFAKK